MTTRDFRGVTYTVQTATSNNQTLTGTSNADWLEALGGNNQISTGAGNDVVLAGVSFTRIGNYPLYGGEAIFYKFLPDAGNNTVDTGSGDDYVATGAGSDVVNLGAGNDIFDGASAGDDKINAGAGNDIIDVGGLGNKTVYAGAGNDIISYTTRGDSTIYAEAGDDSIVFEPIVSPNGPSKALINGGEGNNNILAVGNSQISTGSGDDLIGIVNIFGSSSSVSAGGGADTIFTFSGDNQIYSGLGNDLIVSGTGNDTIYTDGGNDTINLRGGVVNLRGYLVNFEASETIDISGGGNDTVYAGKGNDTFILGTGEGVTTIYNYDAKDRIDLTGLGLAQSDVSLTQNGADVFLNAGSDQLAILKATEVNTVTFSV